MRLRFSGLGLVIQGSGFKTARFFNCLRTSI